MRKTPAWWVLSYMTALLVIVSACVPAVPHALEGRPNCISCHGQNGVKPYPEWHAKREIGNGECAHCHSPKTSSGNGMSETTKHLGKS